MGTRSAVVAALAMSACTTGLAVLGDLAPPAWLAGSYLWEAVLADLHRWAGKAGLATKQRERALALAPTEALRRLLARRLAA